MKTFKHTGETRIYSMGLLILMMVLALSFLPIPGFDLSTLSTNFRWRKDLIRIFETFRLKAGDRVLNNAFIGRDGWLFYSGELSIMDYQNSDPLKKRNLADLQTGLDRLNASLKRDGRTLFVVIVPNKSTVYSQYIPEEIPVIGETSRLDQFLTYMRIKGDTKIIDLRSTLINASVAHDVYYKTDTHWNDLGAYYSYQKIMNALVQDYPMLVPRPLSDFEYTDEGYSTRDLPVLMGMPQIEEKSWALVPDFPDQTQISNILLSDGRNVRFSINQNTALPKLLIFHDSFYNKSLFKFMEPHFGRVTAVPFSKIPGIWSTSWIQKESPDIVIVELVERYLQYLPDLLNSPR